MQPDHNNLVLTCYYCSAPKVRQQVNPASNWLGINFSSSRILVPNHILRCIDTKWLIKPIRVELELPWYRDSSGEHTFSVRVCCQLAHLSALCPDNTWMYINSPPPLSNCKCPNTQLIYQCTCMNKHAGHRDLMNAHVKVRPPCLHLHACPLPCI